MSSGLEIERKFLVLSDVWAQKKAECKSYRICQGYICKESGRTVRIRIRDEKGFLTIKGPSADGIGRYEFEKEITLEEATQLMKLCLPGKIEKTRYLYPYKGYMFEVDEFYEENEGLVMAEVELSSADESFEKPDFLFLEVTGDKRFYNSCLLQHPFKEWKNTLFSK